VSKPVLIDEVAEACAWRITADMPGVGYKDRIASVLRERFEEKEACWSADPRTGYKLAMPRETILVPRPIAPVPSVAEAARAVADCLGVVVTENGKVKHVLIDGPLIQKVEAYRAALKAEGGLEAR
jgi:hypothetical protein